MANPGDPGNAGLDFDRGRRIGKYEIVTRLSIGGMAELFLAFTAGPGGFRKFVALKQILPDVQKDEHFVRMFLDEARITAALAHANIGQVFDLGQEDEELYLAMEFLAGQNLEQILQGSLKQQRPLPLGFAARAVRDACLGLHYAHQFTDPSGKPRPVVHRDVSLKNVMVTFDGHVKVIDFGIAKAKGRLGRTQVGMVKGTTGYMSPEQVRGSEQLDGRSDLFCAGIILHELLCGRRLFTGTHEGDVMLKIAEAAVPSPSSLNPRVPEALSQVVMRALEREPERRFASGREMARAIEAACGPELFHEEQLAAVMRELFDDKLQKTRALLESANGPERDTSGGRPAVALGAAENEDPTERMRRPVAPAPVSTPRVAKPPSGQQAPVAAAPAKTPAPAPRRPAPLAAPARTPARGGYSRPMAAEPEEESEEDPLEKTQPVHRAPGGFRPAPIPDDTAETEEREVTVPSGPPRAQLSPAAQAELEKPRIAWGRWLFLLLLVGAVGGAVSHPPARALLSPLFFTAIEHLKGEESTRGPSPAEPLALPETPPPAEQVAGEGTPAPEPTPQPVAEEPAVVDQAAPAPTPEPTKAESKRTRKPATTPPANQAAAEPPADGEPEIIDTRTAKGAAKAALGWLTLRTIPRAAVFDGENQLGTTPLRKVPLPVDTYRLLVVDPDGVNKMLSVPIKPGQVTDMTVHISDLPAWEAH